MTETYYHSESDGRGGWAESRRVLARLIRQFAVQFLFGYTGIPALWRTTPWYGLTLAALFAVSLGLAFGVGWWYALIPVGIVWFFEVATGATRIIVYVRGMRHSKRRAQARTEEEGDNA